MITVRQHKRKGRVIRSHKRKTKKKKLRGGYSDVNGNFQGKPSKMVTNLGQTLSSPNADFINYNYL